MGLNDIKTIEDAENYIVDLIDRRGTHTHNLISMILRRVESLHGRLSANSLVDKFKLQDFGLQKEPVADRQRQGVEL